MEESSLPATLVLDDSHIDNILEMIVNGTHYKEIAKKYNSSVWKLFCYLHSEQHKERVEEARLMAAYLYADEAENALRMAVENPRLYGVAQAMAAHLRWKAAMFNRKRFATQKVEVPADKEEMSYTINVIEE